MKIKKTKNERGFPGVKFKDYYKEKCSIQISSLADARCIWFGIDEVSPQIMCSDAIRLGLRERTGTEADNGWCDYEIPKEVSLFTRMHLSTDQMEKLLPILQNFVKTGELD